MSGPRILRRRFPPSRAIATAMTTLLLAIAAPVAGQQNPEAAEHLSNAIAALSGDGADPQRALQEVEQVLALDPDNAQAYYYRGMAFGQLQQLEQALESFVTAGEMSPGYTEAHVWATRLAGQFQNWDLAWDQAILASQSGFDMSQAFAELRQASEEPADFEHRLRAPRVLLGPIDVEAILGQDAFLDEDTSPFGSAVGEGASGESRLAASQADIIEVRRTFGVLLQDSHDFAVVQNSELANYVFVLKVNEVGRSMEGIVKLIDGEEEMFSRPVRFSNITSTADLRTEIGRVVTSMEEWLAEQNR